MDILLEAAWVAARAEDQWREYQVNRCIAAFVMGNPRVLEEVKKLAQNDNRLAALAQVKLEQYFPDVWGQGEEE
ncbi:hypothetical protein EI42_02309 [Thermosporothrix hazakensis]|jgi:hypothetical protein|uniref:Uncharacterized protein n=2 Tax=Thermosporothrix TaxID=768650 RepID=A0A326UBZ9_THEHA|nr:hypothetical protein [Thermosporothrix hazakensis]PZW31212.1 hypothetical protein EI42_02309 [Thermosporothrix hazakensis]BBH86568.1 hypothetical protein KTC_13190 [Thermosporothrix sp. COM3]GCE50879.1 hypothetical protein KTH_57480 [Thermosporothrix hazakensis]